MEWSIFDVAKIHTVGVVDLSLMILTERELHDYIQFSVLGPTGSGRSAVSHPFDIKPCTELKTQSLSIKH